MKKLIISVLILCVLPGLRAQDKEKEEEKKFGVKISGFVKNDFFYDSRQTVAAREGHFLLWPSPELLDVDDNDINASPNFNMLAVQSRLTFAISGPDALGAKTSALIEGDFFAQANDNINLLRLRHAFIKFDWEHVDLLAGQYWNPLFVTDCFPGTVSFNTGTPLQSFARNPQIRVAYKVAGIKLTGAILSQRDYSSIGPAGGGTQYLRNSATPDMHLQAQYGFKNDNGFSVTAGAGMAYKTIAPRLNSVNVTGSHKVKERVGGLTAIAFAKLSTKPVTVKLQGRYAENISDLLAISGFAMKDMEDLGTGEMSYTPLKGLTFWGEVHTNGNPQVGIFGGITSNNGTKEERSSILNPVYGRATNIRTLYRISPRIVYNAGKVRLALECEYTAAAYGSNYDTFYIPAETTMAANVRGLLAVYYFF